MQPGYSGVLCATKLSFRGDPCLPRRNRKEPMEATKGDTEAASAIPGACRSDRTGAISPGQVVSGMWEYIRSHNLQNPENRREILADDKLRRVFGKDKVTMFEMNKHLAGHLK